MRIAVTFTSKATGAATVSIVGTGATGSFYVDDVQLEKGEAPSNFNMLENSNMETPNYCWGTRENSGYSENTGIANTDSMRVIGNPIDIQGNFYQIVPINRAGNQSYVFSGWGKADAVTDNVTKRENLAYDNTKQFGLRATLTYVEDTNRYYTEYYYVPFNPDVSEWQYASLTITPSWTNMTVHEITVICVYESNANTAWFDDLSLVSTTVQQMAYDENTGKLVNTASTGLNGQATTYDTNGNVASVTTRTGTGSNDKITYTYTYDSTFVHRMVTSSNGATKETYSYDGVGNVTGTVLSPANTASGSKTISSGAIYTNGGNLIASSTDAAGNTVTYTYGDNQNKMYGQPSAVTDPGRTTTTYELDGYGRTEKVSLESIANVQYNYGKNLLTKLTRTAGTDYGDSSQIYSFTYDGFGNSTAISIGDRGNVRELVSYEYGDSNGLLTKQTYGNGKAVTFTYDILGRAKTTTYSDGRTLTYTYTGDGQLYRVTDSKTGYTYTYSYDSLGRLSTSTVKDSGGTTLIQTRQVYDANNQLTGQQWTVGGTTYTQAFTYSKTTGVLSSMTPGNGHTLSLNYDALQRLSSVTGGIYGKSYTYRDISDTHTTTQVAGLTYDLPSDIVYGYTYDQLGNIATYTQGGYTYIVDNTSYTVDDTTYTYTYDAQNQLTQQTGGGITYTYTYDGAGNILSAVATDGTEENTTSHSYSYDNIVWQDLLTAFDGETITYDAIGNPTSYYNGTRWNFTWDEGRRLTSAVTFGPCLTFTYDSDGLRLTKTVDDGATYNYSYAGGKLIRQTDGTNTLDFFYDESGHPYALTYNGTTYYYVTNLQGDVLHIVDSTGALVVSYSYDPYGKPLTTTGSMAATLGADNPLRYRGYVYDQETGFYYLQSRYYDPTTCRFLNADSYASTGQGFLGHNMFAYCENNPVNRADPTGKLFWTVVGIIAVVALVVSIPSSQDQTPYQRQRAAEKYNKDTINFCVDEIGTEPDKLNVTFYPEAGLIHIEDSCHISSIEEKKAVINEIVNCDYYDPSVYGDSTDTMLMEWSGHNFVYWTSSNSELMYKFYQWRGYEDPIRSTKGVDFRKNLAPSAKRNYELVTLWGIIPW